MKNKGGRPEIYTEELGNLICQRIANGETLRDMCKEKGFPSAPTIYGWLLDSEKVKFFKLYAKAKDAQAELMFDELLEIADDGTNDWMVKKNKDGSTYLEADREHINRSRLRVDTRKWYLSKVLPKKFGDKLDLTSDGKVLPTPILANVLSNNSDKKDSRA